MHGKAATHQAVDEVDLGALDVLGTHRVDEQADATDFTYRIPFLRLVFESHPVGHSRAAARLDEDAETHLGATLLLQ